MKSVSQYDIHVTLFLTFERISLTSANVSGPVPLVLDLRITHERWGSISDPSLNGHLHYPNNLNGPLNETVTDKIRQYRADYNNRPSNTISFIPAIGSTSGLLHCEFVLLLFLQCSPHRSSRKWDIFLPRMYHYVLP